MTTSTDDSFVDNLIDLSWSEETAVDETASEKDVFSTPPESDTPDAREHDAIAVENARENVRNYSRLCGYLNKLGNRNILKTFRKRWFVFNESNCKLYYYRNPHEQVPLGEIDISQATFSFDVPNDEREGLFMISVPGRDYYLEANNQQTCLFWLQELQKHRWINSLNRTKAITEESSSVVDVGGRPQSGLLAQISGFENAHSMDTNLMSPIDCPLDAIGDDSAHDSNNPLQNAHQKIQGIYKQLKTSASFSKSERPSSGNYLNSKQEDLHLDEKDSSGKPVGFGSSTNYKSGSKGFSALRLKLSNSFQKSHYSPDKYLGSELNSPASDNCPQCIILSEKVESLTEEASNLRDEVSTSREVLSVLQRQLDIASKEKDTLIQIYQLQDSDKDINILCEKDDQIVNLTHDLQENKKEVENLQHLVKSLQGEVADLQKNNELFQEMLIQKDKTIMTLTNEVFELETEKRDDLKQKKSLVSDWSGSESNIEHKETMSFDELKDAVQAFELQNKFLNNEILELNQLRRESEDRVRLLSVKCGEWEARCYQIQSKLLYLINELVRSGGGNIKAEILEHLLEDTVDGAIQADLLPSWSMEKVYDDLGFNWRWGRDDLLSLKASNLKQKSEDLSNKNRDSELQSWRSKWDNFMVAQGSRELQRSQELKALVRTGIPNEYRGQIWKGCSLMWIKRHKATFGPNYYNSLLISQVYNMKLDPCSKQIELDLLRTLPNNIHYERLDSDGIPKLRRVLLAFSRHCPDIGYCQGLNRLAAIALLFMEEEDAFWCLVAITKKIMPENYYNLTLIGSHVDQRVLKDLLADKLPRLHAHLEQHNVDLSLFTFNWFFTVFVDNVPVQTYLRIWDVFLYEGSKVLFRYALAILKLYDNDILSMKDYLSINKCLRSISEKIIDAKKLTHVAFVELNPFSIKTIVAKRAMHYPILQAELQELVSMRNSLSRPPEKATSNYLSEED